MAKITCVTLTDGDNYREYPGVSGKRYGFYLGIPTDVKDPKDAKGFIEAANGKAFKSDTPLSKIKEAIKSLIKPDSDEETDQEEIEREEEKDLVTEKQLYDLKAGQQKDMLKELKIDKIPRLEKGRVDLLLKLQKESLDVLSAYKKFTKP